MNESLNEVRRSKSSEEIKCYIKQYQNPFLNKKRFHFLSGPTSRSRNSQEENIKTFYSSNDSIQMDKFYYYTKSNNETKTNDSTQLEKKENEFSKPVDFDFMTTSEKKSFHYDLKIFEKPKVYSVQDNKSFSYSHFRSKGSISENKQINLGVDPFAASVNGFNPEISYENSFFQNENVGEINIPNKKSFQFLNKFSHKDFLNIPNSNKKKETLPNSNIFIDILNVNKLAMGTSITEFGDSDFLYNKRSPKSFYDSLSLEIPDENTKRLLVNDMKYISNKNSMKYNPILTSSPIRNLPDIEQNQKKDDNLVSFNEIQNKMFKKESKNIESKENLCEVGEFILEVNKNKIKKQLHLKDSSEYKECFSNFLNDVSESFEKKSNEMFNRNTTPEFAKFFQNCAKDQNFFKIEKPKEHNEQLLVCSKGSKMLDTMEEINCFSEISEKLNDDINNEIISKKAPLLLNQTDNNNDYRNESSLKESCDSENFDNYNLNFTSMTTKAINYKESKKASETHNISNNEIEKIMLNSIYNKNDREKSKTSKIPKMMDMDITNQEGMDNIINEDVSLRSSRFRRALSMNLMKYQEIERILTEMTKEKKKLGKSLQKLLSLHKNETTINKILKENKDSKLKSNSTKGITKILNRFLEDPKDFEPEYGKFFKKNFLLGNYGPEHKDTKIKQNNKKLTFNSPIISELSLNTTININNSTSNPTSNNLCLQKMSNKLKETKIEKIKSENSFLKKSNSPNIIHDNKHLNKNLKNSKNKNLIKLKKTEAYHNKENNPSVLNIMKK